MACEITWTSAALETFENICQYLLHNWTQKELNAFILKTEYCIDFISGNPKACAVSKKRRNIRSMLIVKQVRVYYKFYPKESRVALLTFFDTRQQSSKLKLK